MKDFSFWENDPKELFDNLLMNFSIENMNSFLQSIWLGDSLSVHYAGELSKAVYLHGEINEVYTGKERDFIEKCNDIIIFTSFTKFIQRKPITCRIIAVDMSWSNDPLYDGIQFMKIFYKAFRSFNIFVMVLDKNIYLGCNLLGKGDNDCFISFPLQDAMDWEAFSDNMMYIEDGEFIPFYRDLLESIKGIKRFYVVDTELLAEEDEFLQERINYKNITNIKDLDVIEFEKEVEHCKKNLSYIKSNLVNPLELLYEAEMMEKNEYELAKKEADEEKINYSNIIVERDDKLKDLLQSPEELIKILTNRK